jgi:hypothetical protein
MRLTFSIKNKNNQRWHLLIFPDVVYFLALCPRVVVMAWRMSVEATVRPWLRLIISLQFGHPEANTQREIQVPSSLRIIHNAPLGQFWRRFQTSIQISADSWPVIDDLRNKGTNLVDPWIFLNVYSFSMSLAYLYFPKPLNTDDFPLACVAK